VTFRIANYYDQIYDALGKDYLREATILEGLLRRHGRATVTVLDVGCGTRRHTRALRGFGYRVAGIDPGHGRDGRSQ
jgi:SAM-dependent methyltransferase